MTAAYDQLGAEGYLAARRGSGTRVALASVTSSSAVAAPVPPVRWEYDLRSGMPALGAFPRTAWIAACRIGLDSLSDHDLGYPEAAGLAALRKELAGYLARVRAMVTGPDDLVITHGSAEALVLLVRSLREAGHTEVAVEDPSYPGQLELIIEHGLRPVPVRVDDEGLRVTDLERTRCRAVVVTSAHQYPLGVVLSPRRRRALVRWAQAVDGLIIEDDYDAEHRYDRPAFGALQALAPERVAYLGTASKTLAPALRLGWLALAGPRRAQVVEGKRLYDRAAASSSRPGSPSCCDPVATTGICARPAASTGSAGMPCWPSSRPDSPTGNRSASRPVCTSCCACRTAWTTASWPSGCRKRGSRSRRCRHTR